MECLKLLVFTVMTSQESRLLSPPRMFLAVPGNLVIVSLLSRRTRHDNEFGDWIEGDLRSTGNNEIRMFPRPHPLRTFLNIAPRFNVLLGGAPCTAHRSFRRARDTLPGSRSLAEPVSAPCRTGDTFESNPKGERK